MSKAFVTMEATYRIVTPMFCAGADQKHAELRLPSIKGALRFWWRSLKWGEVKDPRELLRQESLLFGASDQKVGQSKVRMHLRQVALGEPVTESNLFKGSLHEGTRYFCYGVLTQNGDLDDSAFIPNGEFTLALRCGPGLSPHQLTEVKKSLILLGTVGGLGAKSRKGLGSLTLVSLVVDGQAESISDDPALRLKELPLGRLVGELPDWTAWSGFARLLVRQEKKTDALRSLAFLTAALRTHLKEGNNSAVFGLPRKGTSTPPDVERRASPVFLHVHQSQPDARPTGLVLVLPAQFIPKDKAFNPKFWDPVAGYLKKLANGDSKEVSLV